MRSVVFAAALFTFLFQAFLATGQKGPAVEQGLVRIKVSESLASTLEHSQMKRTSEGIVLTGISGVDAFNRQYRVREFKRVFRSSEKFEARHRKHELHLWYELRIESAAPVLQAVSAYQSLIQIQKAEPVYKKTVIGADNKNFGPVVVDLKKLSSSPALPQGSNDPMLPSQWHYHNTGQTGGTAGADIRLIDAWKKETGKTEVIVAVTDGGIDGSHPDLMSNLWSNDAEIPDNQMDDDKNGFVDDIHGYSFVDDTGFIEPDDHGTHVGGTIAAVTNNGIGVAGVAGGSGSGDGVRLMSCAVFSYWNAAGFAESYIYAADNGAVISQNSWTYTNPNAYEQAVLDAIDYFIAEAGKDENGNQTGLMKGGLVVFAAANNDSQDSYYPSYYPPTFAVASTNHNDDKSWYSNYGAHVDISAPGGETDNVEEEGVLSTLPYENYGYYQGTSMACPHVSGAAALVISKYGRNGLTPEMVRERLRFTATPFTALDPAYVGKMGSGRLDADAALTDEDAAPPSAITDLSIVASDIGKETLSWTVPADAGGFVASYDIRYSTSPITETNFSGARIVQNSITPKSSGSTEIFTVSGLPGGTLFYFAVKSKDFNDNRSLVSNVVSKTSQLAPVITIDPSSITENLQTAQTSSRTFTISNTGPGPLTFSLLNAASEVDFARASPHQGNLAPGNSQVITVAFDANNKPGGTWQKNLRIESNDPEHPMTTVALILQVINNGAPIASVQPSSLHFKSVQQGTSSARKISIHNAGSDPLEITQVTSTNVDFSSNLTGTLTIAPFEQTLLAIIFAPSSTGIKQGTISIQTNDPAHPALTVSVAGEGTTLPAIAATPSVIKETLDKGTRILKTLTLKNNGSFEREFRVEVSDHGLVQDATVASDKSEARVKSGMRTTSGGYETMPHPDPHHLHQDLFPIQQPGNTKSSVPSGKKQQSASRIATTGTNPQYTTGFENFAIGSINEQENWFSNEGWNIDDTRPNRGEKHLRGTAITPGSTSLAISPVLFDEEQYESMVTTVSMHVNLDSVSGSFWEITPQDYYTYVATRIRIHEDRRIEIMSIDENYETVWTTIDMEIPSGYFDLAVEHNGFGEDGSGFPVFDVYLNNRKVFHGYSLAPNISQVAFICETNALNRFIDIDDLDLRVGEYTPSSITVSPLAGIIPPQGSVEVAVDINATDMKYGTYHSDIITVIDESDEFIVPAEVKVVGPGGLTLSSYRLDGYVYRNELITLPLTITNSGGQPFNFAEEHTMDALLADRPNGTIPVRSSEYINFVFDPTGIEPGFYYDTIQLTTTLEAFPLIEIPVYIRIWEERSDFSAPSGFQMQVHRGQIGTKTFQLKNLGQQFVTYAIDDNNVVADFYPMNGKIGNTPADLLISIDARTIQEGEYNWNFVIHTNDPAHNYTSANLNVIVLPPTNNGSGKIMKEEWTNIPGKTVASIPINTPPASVTEITSLSGVYAHGDNYGVRIRGYIQAPLNGYYEFFVASDDHSEVWLSTDMDPAHKTKIAYLNNYVDPGQYANYPSQRSIPILLQRDQKYYIEVLHKEGTGRDHLTVGWELPNGWQEFPIPGHRLFPLNFSTPSNINPSITVTSPTDGEILPSGASIRIAADVSDEDGSIVKVEFYNGTRLLGTDFTSPYSFLWNNPTNGNHAVKVKAYDNFGAADSVIVNIGVGAAPCAGTGTLLREVWTGISGKLVSAIPVNSPPSSSGPISAFESPYNIGDNYGSRVRGYLCVPSTGSYTFWIASDDHSELWLSTDEDPLNKVKIASVTGNTSRRQWDKYPSQKSYTVSLQAGRKYYIEALHKEATGTDHLSVGWQLPDGTLERPIGGNRLIPFNTSNSAPVVTITSPAEGENFSAGAPVIISADASDADGAIARVEFYVEVYKVGEDLSAPYSFTWNNRDAGNFTITVKAFDTDGTVTAASVNIEAQFTCTGSGSLYWDYWPNIPGTSVSAVPVNQTPIFTREVTSFETPQYFDNNYAARLKGYLCVPETGEYTFWIASDDNSELWLSANNDPSNKRKIANVPGHTNSRQWNKYPSQQSATVHLQQGIQYYIEALHKEANGNDHVAVGWQLPDGTLERPIPGIRLSSSLEATLAGREKKQEALSVNPDEGSDLANRLSLFPNPVTGGQVSIEVSGDSNYSLLRNAYVEIASMTGKIIHTERIICEGSCQTHTLQLDDTFPSGVYIVHIMIDGHRYAKKLVVN